MAASVRTLFLLQRPEAWINLASVWRSMRGDLFDPQLWLLPYDFADSSLSAEKAPILHAILDREGVPYLEWRPGMSPKIDQFDCAIFNHPYDRERPPELWFAKIAAVIPSTVYIPYGLPMGGGRKNLRLQFSQPTQTGATAIVARSPFEKQLYSRHCPVGDRHVHVLGHPRFDRPIEKNQNHSAGELDHVIGNRKTLLWNSHFSFGHRHSQSSNFSTFDILGPELFDFALRHSARFCLLWRPHPRLLASVVEEGLLTADELNDLRLELKSCGIVLDESATHGPAFEASDALMTDPGSFLLEYLFTGKPVLAALNEEGEPLNEEAVSLISHYATATVPAEVESFLLSLLCDEVDQPLEQAREQHLPIRDGKAGERVAELILDLHLGVAINPASDPASRNRLTTEFVGKPRSSDPDYSLRDGGALSAAPTLTRLCDKLRTHRMEKAMEPTWRKAVRRSINSLRVEAAEWIKRHPAMLRLIR